MFSTPGPATLRGSVMRSLLESSWRNVEPVLRSRVGEATYESWIAPLRPLAMERGVFHLEAPSRMACDRVAQMFGSLIEDELSREFGTRIAVAVAPKPESFLPDELEVSPERPVIDGSNRTAWLAMQALHDGRELPSSLFFFHGPEGAGKTFLLEAWRSARTGRSLYFNASSLKAAVSSAIRDRRLPALIDELCSGKDLIIDEIHRLGTAKRVQQELARVLERRGTDGPATLLASRWHPRDIRGLERSLETWLLAGFVCRIDLPGPEARLSYLRALEGPPSQNGRAEPVERLAREFQGSYAELRQAWAVERHAKPALRSHYFELIDPRSTFERMRDLVTERYEVDADELCGKCQKRPVSRARKLLAWACVQRGLSRAEVGRYLDRTRAAVSYMISSLDKEMESDNELRVEAEGLL